MKTKFNLEFYLKYDGAICPYCESNDLETVPLEFSSSAICIQDIRCNACEEEWTDEYKLINAFNHKEQ